MKLYWRGEQIANVEEWCRVNNDTALTVKYTKTEYSPFGQKIERSEVLLIPERMYSSLRIGSNEHWEVLTPPASEEE